MSYFPVTALDLSLAATGIATDIHHPTTYKPKQKGDFRLTEIARHLQQFTQPAEVVIMEDLPMGIRNAAAGPLGQLHGAIRLVLIEEGTPYLLVPPASLKCYATGKGNAKKPDMRMSLYQRTNLDLPDDNQVDAVWLYLLGNELVGEPVLDLPQTHRRALVKVRQLNAQQIERLAVGSPS